LFFTHSCCVFFFSGAAGVVTDYLAGRSKENRRNRAEQLTKAISNLGPAIIKGGQALASRPDLLPSEYLEELQKLQDDVPRFRNELAFKTVEQELGIDNFSDVFELVESEPIAAASIGQGGLYVFVCVICVYSYIPSAVFECASM